MLKHVGVSLSHEKHLISSLVIMYVPTSCAREKPNVLSALPHPGYGGSNGFYSVTQHINPSSHIDNVDNQLIAGSPLVGYCNLSN